MSRNSENFSNVTKRLLAERVAHRCSYPSCDLVTIGPNSSNHGSTNLGEAAHIHAASPGGPRYLIGMTSAERSSINNGIWLCRAHARLIDLDEQKYTAATLRQWKEQAEFNASKQLTELQKQTRLEAETIVCLDLDLMFKAVWKSAEKDIWTFKIKGFLFGDIRRLREYTDECIRPMRRYIIVESQGDGRLIEDNVQWTINENNEYEIRIQVLPKANRRSFEDLGSDYATGYDGDLIISDDGDFQIISGVSFAKALIERNLSLPLGSWKANVLLGSLFTLYYNQFRHDLTMLNRIIKIEITRLITISPYQAESVDEPELNFISHIIDVAVLSEINGTVPIFLTLEWSNGDLWSDTVFVKLFDEEADENQFKLPEFMKGLFQENPFTRLDKLISTCLGEPEMKETKTFSTISKIFNEVLPRLMERCSVSFSDKLYPLFHSYNLSRSINENSYEYFTSYDLELACMKGDVSQIGLTLRLNGFKKTGVNVFSVVNNLVVYFNDYTFEIGTTKENIWLRKLYDSAISDEDVISLAGQWTFVVAENINEKLLSFKRRV